jgi:hypothetical protein
MRALPDVLALCLHHQEDTPMPAPTLHFPRVPTSESAITLRLPPEVKAAVEFVAERNHIPMNKWLELLIRKELGLED